jgi:tetratricopeptide (TPR) repeat protein
MMFGEKPSRRVDGPGVNSAVATNPDPFESANPREVDAKQRMKPTTRGRRAWSVLAAVFALLLIALTAAAVYLLTRKPSTVDQVVILTVPSGAEIKLDSNDYGHSPVKLERLKIGTYTLTISKEGFEPIVERITVTASESNVFDYKLKPVLPSEAIGLSTEEQLKQFQQRAEEAFKRGFYGLPYEGSALYYTDLIKSYDANNSFALDMRERIRKAAHQSAQTAVARGDLAQAQEIYSFLTDSYFDDEEARIGAGRVESQLAARRGEVRELVRKAEEALKSGHLTDPSRASAYYYSKQALAIDRQNDRARQIRNQVKETLAAASEQAYARGDTDSAIKQFEQASQLFPEDKQLRSRGREIQAARGEQTATVNDPAARRNRGLDEYQKGNYAEAIPDLESALTQGLGGPAVIFALARSYQMRGHYDQATYYFRSVPATAGDAYVSAIAALGEIAHAKGDTATAVERYKEARQLGGSAIFTVPSLEDKIETIERRQREKAAEPTPLTIQVKHLHGGLLGGSDSGTLTVSASGVVYESKDDHRSYNLSAVQVRVAKDEMVIQVGKDSQKFKVAHADAERFRETLTRYQGR